MRFMRITSWFIAVMVGCTSLFAGPQDKRLDIYWVDVEGGAATLIVTPEGESILIDTGNPGGRDAGRIHKLATEVAGLKQIDHLVTTHFDIDHFGGAVELSKLMPIAHIHDNGVSEANVIQPSKEYLAIPAKRKVIQPGDQIPLKPLDPLGALPRNAVVPRIKCLAARRQFIPAPLGAVPNPLALEDIPNKAEDKSENRNSIVLLLNFGKFKFVDGADLTWNLERKLVDPVNLVGTVDVMQINHHGLDSSNHPMLIRSIEPRVVVMNNGHTKGCQPATFKTVKETKSVQSIYQMHKNLRRDSENNTDADKIANTTTSQDCKAHYIKLSVAPDGNSYIVTVPSTGHSQTYQSK